VDSSRIAAFPVFAELPPEELDELASAMKVVEIEGGSNVVTADDYGTAIYFIEQGNADALTNDDAATQTLGPGDTFGEIALLHRTTNGDRTRAHAAPAPVARWARLRANP
jgi:CRP-like cAMP-binding protein